MSVSVKGVQDLKKILFIRNSIYMRNQNKEDCVKFDEENVTAFLDTLILYWRKKRENCVHLADTQGEMIAKCYIDAYQSVRVSLFGKLLP